MISTLDKLGTSILVGGFGGFWGTIIGLLVLGLDTEPSTAVTSGFFFAGAVITLAAFWASDRKR